MDRRFWKVPTDNNGGTTNDDKGFGVHLSGPNNSQVFTDCCGAVICEDQQRCPECRELVIGWDAETDAKRDRVRWELAYHHGDAFAASGKWLRVWETNRHKQTEEGQR